MGITGIIITVVVVGGLLLAVAYVISVYNALVQATRNADKAWSNIDVLLQQRHDELIKLIDACKGHMKYEADLLTKVVELRAGYDRTKDVNQKIQLENELNQLFSQLRVSFENYPTLTASQSFSHLQGRISALESAIADRRELFNDSINIHNIRIASFPDLLIARPLKFQERPLLKVPDAAKRDVKIALDTVPAVNSEA